MSAVNRLPLPVLDTLQLGECSTGVPVLGGNLQVGFTGTPDKIGRICVVIGDGVIEIARVDQEPIQIEGNVIEATPEGRRLVRCQILSQPVGALTLHRVDSEFGVWENNDELADPAYRVCLSRFAAKMGETVQRKQKLAAEIKNRTHN